MVNYFFTTSLNTYQLINFFKSRPVMVKYCAGDLNIAASTSPSGSVELSAERHGSCAERLAKWTVDIFTDQHRM